MGFGVEVDFNANVAKFSSQVDKINGNLDKFSRQAKRSSEQSARSFNAITGSAKALGIALAGAFSARVVIGGIRSIITEQETLHRNLLRTQALINSTGAAAGFDAGQLHSQAKDIALATLESTDGVLRAQQVLLTFKSVTGDTFTRAIETAADLSATLGTDLNSSVTQLGKALQDPVKGINALSRSGVSFSESSREMIKTFVKTNELGKAQKLILDELAGQYGGIARSEAKELAGSVDTMNQRIEEFKINLGDNTGAMSLFANHVDAIAESVLILDQAINGINTGLVDSSLATMNRKLSSAKDDLKDLKETREKLNNGFSEIFLGKSREVVDKKIVDQENEINRIIEKRKGIMADLNAQRASFNKRSAETRAQAQQPESIQPSAAAPTSKVSSTFSKTSSQLKEMTGPASVWNDMMREAAQVTEQVKTPLENLNAQIQQYTDLADHGLISQETFNRALSQSGKEYNRLTDKVKDSSEEIGVYAEQAARNMQDAFADFLFDPFEDGIEGMLKGFLDVIRRMIAEQAAAQIFGEEGLNVGGLFSSAVSGVGSGIAGLFHDGGVVGSGGSSVAVNPAVFAGASRYHNGGYPGLKPDEVPAILQKGELVLSKKQVASGISGGGVGISINTHVEVSGGNGNQQSANQLGKILNATIKQKLIEEKRPGGLLA